MSKTRLTAGCSRPRCSRHRCGRVGQRNRQAKQEPGQHQARLHHQVPRRLLLHPRRRRKVVAEGAQERQRHLCPGQVGDGRCRRDRRDPGHGRKRRQGNRDHSDQPGRDPRAQQGGQGRREGRADGQRPPDLAAEVVRRRDEQLRRRVTRREVPRDQAQDRRHPRASSRASPACRLSTSGSRACSRASAH